MAEKELTFENRIRPEVRPEYDRLLVSWKGEEWKAESGCREWMPTSQAELQRRTNEYGGLTQHSRGRLEVGQLRRQHPLHSTRPREYRYLTVLGRYGTIP